MELKSLKAKSGSDTQGKAFSIHPTLLNQGLLGPYASGLFQILKNFAGAKNLSRITFMKLNGAGNVWDFGGFDIIDGKMLEIRIPRVEVTMQRFQNNPILLSPTYFVHSAPILEPLGADTLGLLIRDSRALQASDEPRSSSFTLILQ